jgi:hypothetical protein
MKQVTQNMGEQSQHQGAPKHRHLRTRMKQVTQNTGEQSQRQGAAKD